MDEMILEGMWEEVRNHDAELSGQRVRLIVLGNHPENEDMLAGDADEEPLNMPTLDKLFAGYIGRVSFGPPDLARNSEKVIGEIVLRNYEDKNQSSNPL